MVPLKELLAALESPSEDTRIRAVISLVRLNDEAAVQTLKRVARDDESLRVRTLAARGLSGRDLLADFQAGREREHPGADFEEAIQKLSLNREASHQADTIIPPQDDNHPPAGGAAAPANRHVVTGTVGRGGMGVILNAFDTAIQREVAMKVITGQWEASRKFIERFIKEARVQGRLEHPNICPVHELGVDENGHVYFTMKMVQGTSLGPMNKPVPESSTAEAPRRRTEILNLFLKICDAMSFAHSRGIIHRDLKPENIMVGDFGEVYVMDWGLARMLGETEDETRRSELLIDRRRERETAVKTMTGSVVGTPAYMPPEQARGMVDEMDVRSDIYSLGALLYELLALKPPFTGGSSWEILSRIGREIPPPPSIRFPAAAISSELDSIVMKCLEKEKDDRYQTVQELKNDVELYLSGRPISAMEYSAWGVFAKWVGRNKVLATATATIAFILVVSFAVSYVRIAASEKEAIRQRDRAEEQRLAAQAQRDRAEEQTMIAETRHREATANELKAKLSLARMHEERREVMEALDLYRKVREGMLDSGIVIDPFIDLAMWKARYNQGFPVHRFALIPASKEQSAAAVAFSPAGNLGAACRADSTVMLFDPSTGEENHCFSWRGEPASCLAFSADGAYLACGLSDFHIRVWDLRSRKIHAVLNDPALPGGGAHIDSVKSLAFAPGRNVLASAGDEVIKLWDVETGTLLKSMFGPLNDVHAVAFHPDGRRLVSGGREKVVRLWDLERGEIERILYPQYDNIDAVAVSTDGGLVASACEDSTVTVWDLLHNREVTVLRGHRSSVTSVAFNPGGTTLMTAGEDGTVRFWDIARRTAVAVLKEEEGGIESAAFHPGGKIAAVVTGTGCRLLSTAAAPLVKELNPPGHRVQQVAFSPDGGTLAAGTAGSTLIPVLLYDTATGTKLCSIASHGGKVLGLAISPDGRQVASVGKMGQLKIGSLTRRRQVAAIDVDREKQTDFVSTIVDAASAAVTSADGEIFKAVEAVAYSPVSGGVLATGSEDGTVKLWDSSNYRVLHTFSDSPLPIKALHFSPDGRVLVGSGKDALLLWNIADRTLITRIPSGSGHISTIDFNPSGDMLASGHSSGVIRLWNFRDRRIMRTLAGHIGSVYCVDFHPAGRLLASGGSDSTIRLWDVETGNCLLVLAAHAGDVESIDFSPDGNLLAAGGRDRIIRMWNFTGALPPLETAP